MFVNKEMGFRRNSFGTMVKFAWLIRATANRQNNTWKCWLWTRHRASPECFALCVLNYPSTGYLDCFANGVQCLCKQLTAWIVFNIYVSIRVIFTMWWNSLCSNSEWVTFVLIQMMTILLLQILLTERHCRVGGPNRRIL